MIVRIYDIVSTTKQKKTKKKPERMYLMFYLLIHRNRHTDTDICKRYNFAE